MNQIKQVHAYTLRHDIADVQRLLLQLLRLSHLPYAHALLISHPHPPPAFLYNHLLRAYAAHAAAAFFEPCLALYAHMRRALAHTPAAPNRYTFVSLFAACAAYWRPGHGRALHVHLLISGIPLDAVLATSLLDMYAKTGFIGSARQLFDEMPDRDAALWNSMIGGYARRGELEKAEELFERMPDKNVITWTTMVSGYAQNGLCQEAVDLFQKMWKEEKVRPNEVTIASVLPACASLGAMSLGRRIEAYARQHGLVKNVFVSNALLEMYAKCGDIEQARQVFDELGSRRNLCSWNSIITGLAVHGRWQESLELFHEMQETGIVPDDITFVGILLACIHGGLVDQGQHFFSSMDKDFSLTPKLEHYGCMVDLLGRAGLLKEAYSLITSMSLEPDAVIWGALLGACSVHGEVQLAEIAVHFLSKLEPWNTGNYVILSNIYASSGKWNCVGKTWKLIKVKQHRKLAGYSLIELDGTVHKFLVEDMSHPESKAIYRVLDAITALMKLLQGYRPNLNLQTES